MYKKITNLVIMLMMVGLTHATSIHHTKINDDGYSFPFEPLTKAELTQIIKLIKNNKQYSKNLIFTYTGLQEPQNKNILSRQAIVCLFDPTQNKLYEIIISLKNNAIIAWKYIPSAQPMANQHDYDLLFSLIKNNKQWLDAIKKRGITNIDKVEVIPWIGEPSNDLALRGHRFMYGVPYYSEDGVYIYGQPIEGLSVKVDLTAKKVYVIDTRILPLAKNNSAYDKKSIGPVRTAPNTVYLKQNGHSFKLKNHQVTWQKWRFNIGFNPRDGLILYQIQYFDRQKWRSIIYRLSLSDIFVPYGDPDPQWRWRHALDASEYGLGYFATPIQKGLDVPENAYLMSIPILNYKGKIQDLPNRVALYEEYGGLSWKHFDADVTDKNDARRAQNLVVGFNVAISNYDYLINYIFKQDGSIQVVVYLTGIMLPKGLEKDGYKKHDYFSHPVTKEIAAPHHQHFFNFRIDFDVDGEKNSVVEQNTNPMPVGKNNPEGNAFIHQQTPLTTSLRARRNINLATDRFWVITNLHAKNALDHPVGYALIPGGNTIPYSGPDSNMRQMSEFTNYHFWVTPYHSDQMNASGVYPVLNNHIQGLKQWAEKDESIQDTDLVVWYTMGVTHIPRLEEWPVMPLTDLSFKILPIGFFDRNPALDLPK